MAKKKQAGPMETNEYPFRPEDLERQIQNVVNEEGNKLVPFISRRLLDEMIIMRNLELELEQSRRLVLSGLLKIQEQTG